jgi:hypothetical protein
MLSLDVGDPRQADIFVEEVVEEFKAHRMCSPPDR